MCCTSSRLAHKQQSARHNLGNPWKLQSWRGSLSVLKMWIPSPGKSVQVRGDAWSHKPGPQCMFSRPAKIWHNELCTGKYLQRQGTVLCTKWGKIRIWKKCRGRKNKCILYTTHVTNDMHTFMFIYKYKQKDSESLGESSTPQAYMVVSHKFLPRSNSCKDLALPDFNRLVLWDIWKDDQDLVWFKWPMTLKPKAQVI